MTIEEKKRFLKRYAALDRCIRSRMAELAGCRDQMKQLYAAAGAEEVPGPADRQLKQCAQHISALEEELVTEIKRLVALRKRIAGAVALVDDARQREALEERYLHGLTIKEVAGRMYYSTMQVHRILNQALEKVPL